MICWKVFYCDEVLSGSTSVEKDFETPNVLAYHHTRPFYLVHGVVIPKKHIPSDVVSTLKSAMLKHMNANIESFHRLLEDGCLSSEEFNTYGQAYEAVVDFMEFYNARRLHSSLYYMSPDEFHKKHQTTGVLPRRNVKV